MKIPHLFLFLSLITLNTLFTQSIPKNSSLCHDAELLFCPSIQYGEIATTNSFNRFDYAGCYSGSRSYNGNDRLYELTIQPFQQYKVVVKHSSAQRIDLFLLDECGGKVSNCLQSSIENEGDCTTDILDIFSTVRRTYYIVVDNADSGGGGGNGDGEVSNANYFFDIEVICDCTCEDEETGDNPDGRINLCENFDYMDQKSVTEQSTRWRLWSAGSPTAEVQRDNNSDFNFLKVNTNFSNNDRPDLVYMLEEKTSGRYRLSWDMLVRNGLEGYYNILHQLPYPSINNALWAYHVYFNDGNGELIIGSSENDPLATFTYPQNQYIDITNIIDIDQNIAELWIDHQFITSWAFNQTNEPENFSKKLSGINFYAASPNDNYHIDNICFWQKTYDGRNTFDGAVCLANGNEYPHSGAARADLYISPEWESCNAISCEDAIPLQCGEYLDGQSVTENNFNVAQYGSCYDGTATYNGFDGLYKIEVESNTSYKFILHQNFSDEFDLFLLNECDIEIPVLRNSSSSSPCVETTTISEGNTRTKILDFTTSDIDEGLTYYLIVDAATINSGNNFDLEVSCDCTCTEPENDTPDFANIIACENFENMRPESVTAQSTKWQLWSEDAPTSFVVDEENKYLQIIADDGQNPDVIYRLDKTHSSSGRYRLSWRMLVNPNRAAYFNILRDLPTASQDANRYLQVYFNEDQTGRVTTGGIVFDPLDLETFTYSQDVWFDVGIIVDFTRNIAEVWLDHRFITEVSLPNGDGEINIHQLGGINFYANTNNNYLVDDICVWKKGQICGDVFGSGLEVCVLNGEQYFAEHLARCEGLYISSEWQDCYTVCDVGGQLIYRGQNFSSTLGENATFPPQLLHDPCITEQLTFEAPIESLAADIYVFDNDAFSTQINAQFNFGITQGFVFTCECIETETGIQCTQTCLGEFEEVQSNNLPIGLYYLVVIGEQDSEYDLVVFPSGPCNNNGSETIAIGCNETVTGDLSFSQGPNFSVNGEIGDYSSCYSGNRRYEGNDQVYELTMDFPSTVDISLRSSDSRMAVFLYSYLCGQNCINYAEIIDGEQETILAGQELDAGVYYLIVDQEFIGEGEGLPYELEINCEGNDSFIDILSYDNDEDVNCTTDQNAEHEILINSNAARSETFSLQDTELFFYHYDETNNRRYAVHNELWGTVANAKAITIYEDAGNNEQCSYITDDSIRLDLYVGRGVSGYIAETDLVFNSTDSRVFLPSTTNTVTQIRQKTVSFDVSVPLINVNADANTTIITVTSNLAWNINEVPNVNWVAPSFSNGTGTQSLNLDFLANNSQFPRTTTLLFTFESQSRTYRREVPVIQQGRCYEFNANIEQITDPQTICQTGTVQLRAFPSIIPNSGVNSLDPNAYAYRWSDGSTDATLDVANPQDGDTYTVTIATNTGGNCNERKTISFQLDIPPAPQIPVSLGNENSCLGEDVPTLAVSVGNGLTAEWYRTTSGGTPIATGTQFTPTNFASTPGTYDFFVQSRNASNCVSNRTVVTLEISESPAIDIVGNTALCVNETEFLQINVSQGVPPYTIAVNGQLQSTNTFEVVGANASYSVAVTDANNCTTSQTVNTTLLPLPIIDIENTDANCNIANGTASVQLQNNVTVAQYRWSNGSTSRQIQNLAAGTYSVTVETTDGCITTASTTISDTPVPTFNLEARECSTDLQTYTVRFNSSADLINTNGVGNISSSGSNYTIEGVPSGQSFSVQLTDNATGCVISQSISPPDCTCSAPAPTFVADVEACTNESAQLQVIAPANHTVNWYNASNQLMAANTDGSFTATTAGTYFAKSVENVSGCESGESTTVRFTWLVLPTISLTNTLQLCPDETESITIEVEGGTLPYRFIVNGTPQTNANLVVNATESAYLIEVEDNNGCTATHQLTIAVNKLPELAFQKENASCNEANGSITVSIENDVNIIRYAWDNGAMGNQITGLAPGTYNVTVETADGCETDAFIVIDEIAAPVITSIEKICSPELETYALAITTTADAINTSNAGTVDFVDGIYQISEIPLEQIFEIRLIDNATNCIIVENINPPDCSCTAVAPTFISNAESCVNESVELQVIPPANHSVNWYNAAGDTLAANTNGSFTTNQAGTYFATSIDNLSGCESLESTAVQLEWLPTPQIQILSNANNGEVCAGSKVILSALVAEGHENVVWQDGSQGGILEDTPETTTTYIATLEQNGCFGSDTLEIEIIPVADWSIEIIEPLRCNGDNAIIRVQDEVGNLPTSTTWSTSNSINPEIFAGAGMHQATIEDANGCEVMAEIELTEPEPILVLNTMPEPTLEDQNTGSLSFIISGGIPEYMVFLHLNSPTGEVVSTTTSTGEVSFNNLAAGSYFIEIIDNNDCAELSNQEILIETSTATDVIEVANGILWDIYPNPASDLVFVECNETLNGDELIIHLTDITGRQLLQRNWKNSHLQKFSLPLPQLATGIYLVQLQRGSQVFIEKLIIQQP